VKVQIICSSPGMWRNGIQHSASEFYPADRWTEEQIARFKADPAFTVREVDENAENTLTETDFNLRVDAEVKRQTTAKIAELQSQFAASVSEAVKEKTASLKAEHDNAIDALGKELQAMTDKAAQVALDSGLQLQDANTKIAGLETQLDAAKKKPASTK
jgi:bisphosphoglycerate-dependent phosphoglycerate mutase